VSKEAASRSQEAVAQLFRNALQFQELCNRFIFNNLQLIKGAEDISLPCRLVLLAVLAFRIQFCFQDVREERKFSEGRQRIFP
jgi:hypothetical protein